MSIAESKAPVKGRDSQYSSAVYEKDSGKYYIKVVNKTDNIQKKNVNLKGKKFKNIVNTKSIKLQSDDIYLVNTLENPYKIIPVEDKFNIENGVIIEDLSPKTFAIYEIECEK